MPSEPENLILIKRSNISGVVPVLSDLEFGELGINTADGKLFTKTEINSISSIKTFLNSDDYPYTLNHYYSSVNFKYGNNTVNQIFAGVLGGYNNDVSGGGSTVVNGEDNDVAGDFSIIGSGLNNKISSIGDYGAILGGKNNQLNHSESFIIGSNLTSHLSGFTYVNNISAQGFFYGDGSQLTGIIASGVVGPDTEVRSLSSNWQSTYITVSSLSASWASTTADYLPLSGGTLTGTILGDISATGSFYGDGSNLTGIVAGDSVATTLVRSNSAFWENAYTTTSSLSSSWQTTFQASSAYVSSNPTGITGASALTKMIQITQSGYNSIIPSSDTLYIIVG
jgi:hypothetical protein